MSVLAVGADGQKWKEWKMYVIHENKVAGWVIEIQFRIGYERKACVQSKFTVQDI